MSKADLYMGAIVCFVMISLMAGMFVEMEKEGVEQCNKVLEGDGWQVEEMYPFAEDDAIELVCKRGNVTENVSMDESEVSIFA